MRDIDLKKIIEAKSLDEAELAGHLFPEHKYPAMALARVIKGDGLLNSQQLSKLSALTGLTVSELYDTGMWAHSSVSGMHTFTFGDFEAKLDTATWRTAILHKNTLFHDEVIHSGTTTLSEYIKSLNLIVTKYNSK